MGEPSINLTDHMKFTQGMIPHVQQILAGEYMVAVQFPPETILDIGANEGAFTAWARKTWPRAYIKAFEPVPANADIFQLNHGNDPRISLGRCAVAEENPTTIYLGRSNSGCASRFQIGEQTSTAIQVPAVFPREVGAFEFIKIDTEGNELEILKGLNMSKARSLVLEYHRESDILPIIEEVNREGLRLVDFRHYCQGRGILKFHK